MKPISPAKDNVDEKENSNTENKSEEIDEIDKFLERVEEPGKRIDERRKRRQRAHCQKHRHSHQRTGGKAQRDTHTIPKTVQTCNQGLVIRYQHRRKGKKKKTTQTG